MQEERVWKEVSPNLARRPLVGVEKLLNYAEYYQNGNVSVTQLGEVQEFELEADILQILASSTLTNVSSSS